MSPILVVVVLAVLWIAAVALWLADVPDPRSRVDLILQQDAPLFVDEQLAA